MPTPLPTRRSLLRRYAPDRETKQNLVATFGEFGLALVFVAVTVCVIAMIERGGAASVAARTPPVVYSP